MRKMREKSAQAAEQRRVEHAEERAQEERRAAQWEASGISQQRARRTREMADRRLVEVNAIGEAQGAAVAYVPEGGGTGSMGHGCGWCIPGLPGEQEQRGGYQSQQRGEVPRWPERGQGVPRREREGEDGSHRAGAR